MVESWLFQVWNDSVHSLPADETQQRFEIRIHPGILTAIQVTESILDTKLIDHNTKTTWCKIHKFLLAL